MKWNVTKRNISASTIKGRGHANCSILLDLVACHSALIIQSLPLKDQHMSAFKVFDELDIPNPQEHIVNLAPDLAPDHRNGAVALNNQSDLAKCERLHEDLNGTVLKRNQNKTNSRKQTYVLGWSRREEGSRSKGWQQPRWQQGIDITSVSYTHLTLPTILLV